MSTPAEEQLKMLRALVDRQAMNEGLWFSPRTLPEWHLQEALRELHRAVEGEVK